MEKTECPKLKTLFSELLTQRSIFGAEQKNFTENRQREEIVKTRWQIEDKIKEMEDILRPFEKILKLRQQYDSQLAHLANLNLLKKLPGGKAGFEVGGREFLVPSYKEICQKFKNNWENLKNKVEQGFTKFLLVPFGQSLAVMVNALDESINKHMREGTINVEITPPDVPKITMNASYVSLMEKDKFYYYPANFEREQHGGEAKEEILKRQDAPGWNPILVEEIINIPKPDEVQTKGGRTQIAAGKTVEKRDGTGRVATVGDYLDIVILENTYRDEKGMTPEDYITLMITMLEEKNLLIDTETQTILVGAFNPLQNDVPFAGYSTNNKRAYFTFMSTRMSEITCGIRTTVRI